MNNIFDKFCSIFEFMVSLYFICSSSSGMYFKGVQQYDIRMLVALTC